MPRSPAVVFAVFAFVGVLVAAFFLQASGLTTLDLLSFSISDKVAKVFSANFIAFLVFLPLVGGLISAAPGNLHKLEALFSIVGGSALGCLISGLLFSNLPAFMWPGIFFLIGSALAIQLVYMKKLELKSWVGARLGFASVQRQMMFVALGLAVWGMVTILPQQEIFSQNFENELVNLSLPTGNGSSSANDTITDAMVQMSVNSQKQLVQQIVQGPQYQALQSSQAVQDTEFVTAMSALQLTVNSDSYKQSVKSQVRSQLRQNPLSGEQLMQAIKQKMPLLTTIEEWLWLIFSIGIASIFLFIAGIILQPLGMFWGVILQQTVGRVPATVSFAKKAPPKAETAELPITAPQSKPSAPKTAPNIETLQAAKSSPAIKSPFEIKPKEKKTKKEEAELFPPGEL